MGWRKIKELERKIENLLKISDKLPPWASMIIYFISVIVSAIIGKGAVSVMPDLLKEPVSLIFGVIAMCLMLAAAWQFGNIWKERGFCTVLHRLIIIWFIFAVIAVLFISVTYMEAVCSCNG